LHWKLISALDAEKNGIVLKVRRFVVALNLLTDSSVVIVSRYIWMKNRQRNVVKMFDLWIDWAKKKMFGKYEAEIEDQHNSRFHRGFMKFMTQIMPSIMSSLLIFAGMFYIFEKVHVKYGIERVVMVFGIIIILSLRGISRTLQQAVKD
jgi:hypothetical protein